MILHDWNCPKHGGFEGSHDICPFMGCESEGVVKVYKKAPGFVSETTKRTDAGFRASAASMGLTDLKSAREGETAHPGVESGTQVLWGDEIGKRAPGTSFASLSQTAEQNAVASGQTKVASGMRQAASQFQLTKRVLPMIAECTKSRVEA